MCSAELSGGEQMRIDASVVATAGQAIPAFRQREACSELGVSEFGAREMTTGAVPHNSLMFTGCLARMSLSASEHLV